MNILQFISGPFLKLWGSRELVYQFSKRTVQQRTKGTVLGTFWQLLQPLLMMALYTIVFGVIFQGGFSNQNGSNPLLYGAGIYLGLNLLGLINDTIGISPFLIVSEPGLVKKVVFPLEIIPFSNVIYPLIQTLSGLVLSTGLLLFLGIYPNINWFLIPLIIIPLFMLAVGLSWIISSISVFIRDLSHLMALVTQVTFWTSGIFFNAEMAKAYPSIWAVLRWNPILLAIDELRKIMLWDGQINWNRIGFLYLTGIICWYLGLYLFDRLRKRFADVM